MREYRVHTEGLCAGYDGKPVLRDITLTVRGGEVLTLVGPNGAGKSTLLKTLVGQLPPIGGTAFLNGKSLAGMSDGEIARTLSVVTTERIGGEWLTVEDVARSGRYPYTGRLGILSARDKEAVENAMRRLQVADLRERRFRELSDGQRQRVLLARALCQEPDVLVMDEPTSFLDLRYQLELRELLRDLVAGGNMAVILSTHELQFARRVSDAVVCVRDGIADRIGPPDILTPEYVERLYNIPPGRYAAAPQSSSRFAQNRACEYFPCHAGVGADDFNCLFCYCPLYALGERCGGNFAYTDGGVKNCAGCSFPHVRENYAAVLARFPELARLAGRKAKPVP